MSNCSFVAAGIKMTDRLVETCADLRLVVCLLQQLDENSPPGVSSAGYCGGSLLERCGGG